jgi:ferric-dicitrate binding protein FerR (iron transport regulator)
LRGVQKSSTPRTEEAALNPPQSSGSATTDAALPSPPPPVQSSPPAPLPFAKLYANGKVLVNGQSSTASYIFAGDWVDTPDGAEATVVGDNFELVLRSGSRLSVDQSGVQLARGDVLVTTTGGTPVKTSSVSVTPRNTPNARFEVFDQSDGVRVMTYQGSVLVQ